MRSLFRCVLLLFVAWVSFVSVSASAQPVLYRVTSYTGDAFLTVLPAPVHPTISMAAPGVATVMTNGASPASVMFPAGDLVYSNQFTNPSPATGLGIFYSRQGWDVSNLAGTVGPNPAAGTVVNIANGFPAAPPDFPATGPQPTVASVTTTPGSSRFGGTWDLGVFFDTFFAVADAGGGFNAGRIPIAFPPLAGGTLDVTTTGGGWHTTGNPLVTTPVFSDTACPTSPATCPWAGATLPFQLEFNGGRLTTGMVTVVNALPPFPLLPPTGTITQTGLDARSGPVSSMGTLQLVSGFNAHTRGAFNIDTIQVMRVSVEFLPEPTSTGLLIAGIGVPALWMGVRRRLHRRT